MLHRLIRESDLGMNEPCWYCCVKCQKSGSTICSIADIRSIWLEHYRPSLRFPGNESRFFCCRMLSVLLLYRLTPYYPYAPLFEAEPEYSIPPTHHQSVFSLIYIGFRLAAAVQYFSHPFCCGERRWMISLGTVWRCKSGRFSLVRLARAASITHHFYIQTVAAHSYSTLLILILS